MFELTHSPAWLGALGSAYMLLVLFQPRRADLD